MSEQPPPAPAPQPKGWGCGKAFFFVAALAAVAVAALFIVDRFTYERTTPEQVERQAERERENAELRVHREARLKAPGTAEWEKVPRVERLAQGRYEVAGWVDAENAFGARLRNDYRCVVAGDRVVEVGIQGR